MTGAGRFIFPSVLILSGLAIIYSSTVGGQNVYWLMGGIFIALVGTFALLLILDKLSTGLQKAVFFAFVPIALAMAYFSYMSIDEPIKFNQEKKRRYTKVVENLKTIREWQLAYKSVNRLYASNFDSLLHFVENGEFPVVRAIGTVPDTLTEAEALKLGIIKRDTIMMSVRDSLFKSGGDINRVRVIPYSENVEFKMESGIVEKGAVQVPVFEVFAANRFIFPDYEPIYFKAEQGLKVGSMTDPSTSGNWE